MTSLIDTMSASRRCCLTLHADIADALSFHFKLLGISQLGFGMRIARTGDIGKTMLKISINDSTRQRRVVLRGKLSAPWVAELRTVCSQAKEELDGRELVIDIGDLLAISQEGENALVQLINDGAKFSCHGVVTSYVLQQLARQAKSNGDDSFDFRPPCADPATD